MKARNLADEAKKAALKYAVPVVAAAVVAMPSYVGGQRVEDGKLLWPEDKRIPDFNGDDRIGIDDFYLLRDRFGSQRGDPNYDEKFDIGGKIRDSNGLVRGYDGLINMADLMEFAEAFGLAGRGKIPVEIVRSPAIYYNHQGNLDDSRSKPVVRDRR